MVGFGWTVLALVFLDEVLAAVAAGVWGASAGGVLLAVLAPVVVVALWWLLASPRAPYGGPVRRPVTKVLVFVLASAGLVVSGHPVLGTALLVFSAVVNGLALLPGVRSLVDEADGRV